MRESKEEAANGRQHNVTSQVAANGNNIWCEHGDKTMRTGKTYHIACFGFFSSFLGGLSFNHFFFSSKLVIFFLNLFNLPLALLPLVPERSGSRCRRWLTLESESTWVECWLSPWWELWRRGRVEMGIVCGWARWWRVVLCKVRLGGLPTGDVEVAWEGRACHAGE